MRAAQCTWSLFAVLAACGSWLALPAQAQPSAAAGSEPTASPAEASGSGQTAPDAPNGETSGDVPAARGAQSDEVISDPELQASPAEPAAGAASADGAIDDPELRSSVPEESSTPPSEPNGQMRIVLRSRTGVDTLWQDPREDVWESTQIALFEAKIRRSEHLRFEVGVRARYMFASREHDLPDQGATRYELDVAPTAAYADATLSDGFHLRIGYQSVRLGRFDVLNPSDILSSYDLRSGMSTMPEAREVAQPAVRIDWDIGSWLSLTAIGLPFFQPHVVRAFDGDYALAPSTDADVAAAYAFAPDRQAEQAARALVRNTLSRTGQGQFAESGFSAFAPRPNFSNPQASLRLTAHGPAGELGLTAGTALEHLPAPRFSAAFMRNAAMFGRLLNPCAAGLTSGCIMAAQQIASALLPDTHPVDVTYDRFELLSIDGAMPIGPFQLGVELAYMFKRVEVVEVSPPSFTIRHSDLAHAGLRLEWLRSETWVIAVETMVERAIQLPSGPDHFYFMTKDGWVLAALGFVTLAPFDGGPLFEIGGGVLNGPTYVLAPRVEQRLIDRFYVEVGASLLGGRKSTMANPSVTLGGLYSYTNQVFLGLRWQP